MDNDRVLVTGGKGMLGQQLQKYLISDKLDIYYVDEGVYDLTCEDQVAKMYKDIEPQRVIHLAAKVGGIFDNINYPIEYLEQNVLINTFTLKWAHKYDVSRFTGILTTCAYPNEVDSYPMKEEQFLQGIPALTNINYAYTKRLQGMQIDSYNKQYNKKWNYLIPCNLYGRDEGKNLEALHFIPALIRKIQNAVTAGEDKIILFGDGTPIRQFMYAKDLARVITRMVNKDITKSCNVAVPWNLSIAEMADITMRAMDVDLKIEWDTDKPNGQHRRDVSTDKFNSLFYGFQFTSLTDGVRDIIS